jgi:DNA-binding NarL/FixJ family response regulator
MGDVPQTHPNNAKIGAEQTECLQLRLEGKSFRAIAEATGIPLATVYARVEDAIALEVNPRAEHLRAIECERLEPRSHSGRHRAAGTDSRGEGEER